MAKMIRCEFSEDQQYCKMWLSYWFGLRKEVKYAYRGAANPINWFWADTNEYIAGELDPWRILRQRGIENKLEECKKALDKPTKRVV